MMRNKIDYYLKGIYGKIIRRVMRKFPVDVKMSLGDILLQRENITHPQFAVSLLLLDIEKYLENGDASFFHKRTSQSLIRKVMELLARLLRRTIIRLIQHQRVKSFLIILQAWK